MAGSDNGLITLGILGEAALSRTGPIHERVAALYESQREKVYRFLVGQGLDPAVAQEVTQDVFVDLFIALQRGVEVKSEQGWLYAVAGRAAVDYWRREGRPIWVELDTVPSMAANLPSQQASPEACLAQSERLNRVADGLRRLPKEHRLCIHLRMQGLRYREIGKILGVSTSTAAEWISSAVERLRGEGYD